MWMNHANSKLLVEVMTPISKGISKKIVNYTTKESIEYTIGEIETARKILKYALKYLDQEEKTN